MNSSEIVHLDQYRGKREARLKRALALQGHDAVRSALLHLLSRLLSLVGAERAAVLWVDEFGPEVARPHTVLDLASDRPRRRFPVLPLQTAWAGGVPGLFDLPAVEPDLARELGGARSLCAVALGSDGVASWYVVADSLTPRASLDERTSCEVMFLAGEAGGLVLHRDMDREEESLPDGNALERHRAEVAQSFSGWPVLRDLDGREETEALSTRIMGRFLVYRLVRRVVEDNLIPDPESIEYQINGTRREIRDPGEGDGEHGLWHRIIDSVETMAFEELLGRLLEWGRVAETMGHLHGALEIQTLAYDLAVAIGAEEEAADAARFQGKICRTQADWEQAFDWYHVALEVARSLGDRRKEAVILDGLANTYRDRGNLPKAREILENVLESGVEVGDRYIQAIAHHDLMTVLKLAGEVGAAIEHGWAAAQYYDSQEGQLRALFDLAGVLRESGALTSAKDAYWIVAARVAGFEYRILSLDALAFIAALEGDREEHDRLRERMEEEGWERLSPVYRAQVLYYRGLAARALGLAAESRDWLERALALARRHHFGKLVFDAEAALEESPRPQAPFPDVASRRWSTATPAWEPPEKVRLGLRALREAVPGALAGAPGVDS